MACSASVTAVSTLQLLLVCDCCLNAIFYSIELMNMYVTEAYIKTYSNLSEYVQCENAGAVVHVIS